MSETSRLQTIGFEGDIATYDERGWPHIGLFLNRQGDTSNPLVVNVKISPTLNDTAPGAQWPLYHHAIEMHWKAGETGRKEVPIRIKVGSVQVKPLLLEAVLEIPLGQEVELDKGCGYIAIRIDNQHTTKYPDKSAEYIPLRSTSTPTKEPIEVSITPFIPPIH